MVTMPAIFSVTCHTRYVGQGSTFVAIQGQKEDGIKYVPHALEQGAKKIIVQNNAHVSPDLIALIQAHQAALEYVDNTRRALAQLSAQALGYPAKKLKIIGVTGTKGKTSTTFLIEHMLRSAGYRTALLGTVKNFINGQQIPGELTTPQPDYLHQFLVLCVQEQVDYVIMEVAAQAFTLHRVYGIEFDLALFTNFSQEHGEFYATQDEYFAAKKEILSHLKPDALLLVNADDEHCKKLLKEKQVKGFSLANEAVGMIAGCRLEYKECVYDFSCPTLIGNFNCYNVLAAVSAALRMGLSPESIQASLQTFPGVPGRLEKYVLPNGAYGIIDYAHNPSSFEAVLSTLRKLTDRLIVVFGCGGDRDASKRPIMGAIAAEYADLVILTTDNPRSENPRNIIEDIYRGVQKEMQAKIVIELDREKAIRYAYAYSRDHAIIALLGKGPDEYQQIGSVKYPFSEKKILQQL
jgi:UDP-N-acetylmuramoyl-L-alanyl-D-glutamate--2,6-diaminopimelate ligase